MKRFLASVALALVLAVWAGAGASVAWAAPAHHGTHSAHPQHGPMVSDFVW
ncbi:MAG: hypothetical protein IRZ18_04530 [Clostridia bacterium]|nr:hypothetical protein [Clostridia bacterium]